MLNIFPIPALKDNYIWMIHNPENNHCVCVDPGDAKDVIALLKNRSLELDGILITHHHPDHTSGIKTLLEFKKVNVYGPANETIISLTHPLKEKDIVQFENLKLSLQVLDIPGHTIGHIAYYTPDMVFTGDTLFTAGCGRIFEGDAKQMFESLSKLTELPDNTLIYCGHEYTLANLKFSLLVDKDNPDIISRLKDVNEKRNQNLPTVPASLELEKKTNPFLRCSIPEVIDSASQYIGETLINPIAVFAVIREWKNSL